MRNVRRRAFTLFQLLVVLALAAILLGLLLPALQKVREAAARAQSANNLKQIGLACHNYHDVNGKFCPGADDKYFSAAARLLPYIEQNNLFQTIDFTKPASDDANARPRGAVIKTYLSPRDPVTVVSAGSGPTNYLFSAGSKAALKDNDGVFYLNSGVRLPDITDGTSNTLMTGETLKGDGGTRAVDVRRQHVKLGQDALGSLDDDSGVSDFKNNKNVAGNRGAAWIDGRFLQDTFTATRVADDARPDVDCAGQGGLSGLRSLGGGGTVTVGMCDGSVRTIGKKLGLDVWKNLGGRNDGNVIPEL